jgi:putative RNA 2'-phosphotransferase
MSQARLVRISKMLSLILRHKPKDFGVVLDPEGFASLDEVVRALRVSIADASEADVRAVVATLEPDKARFALTDQDIRANYGHSLSDRIVQIQAMPPDILLHGTSEGSVAAIRRDGIRPMRRQYVHLTTHRDLASRVGARHGSVCVLEVEAIAAHRGGLSFYRANDAFWLADFIPPEFIRSL